MAMRQHDAIRPKDRGEWTMFRQKRMDRRIKFICPFGLAEQQGFEPWQPYGSTRFRVTPLRPLEYYSSLYFERKLQAVYCRFPLESQKFNVRILLENASFRQVLKPVRASKLTFSRVIWRHPAKHPLGFRVVLVTTASIHLQVYFHSRFTICISQIDLETWNSCCQNIVRKRIVQTGFEACQDIKIDVPSCDMETSGEASTWISSRSRYDHFDTSPR